MMLLRALMAATFLGNQGIHGSSAHAISTLTVPSFSPFGGLLSCRDTDLMAI